MTSPPAGTASLKRWRPLFEPLHRKSNEHNLIASLRSFWNGLRRPSQLDADMNDEMRFHIDMEARRLMEQQRLDRVEAHRRAAIAFGGVEKYRGAGRDALGLTWLRGMSTDFKLGTRMLRRYPGLTAVALFALSLAIGAGSAYLEFVNDLMHGKLPFPDADRIVGIQIWDRETGAVDKRGTADFVAWRGSLRSFEDLAAYRPLERSLITDDGRAEPARGVEISASAFRIARVPPLLGRPLVPDDERSASGRRHRRPLVDDTLRVGCRDRRPFDSFRRVTGASRNRPPFRSIAASPRCR